jgi:hypothetical protein
MPLRMVLASSACTPDRQIAAYFLGTVERRPSNLQHRRHAPIGAPMARFLLMTV